MQAAQKTKQHDEFLHGMYAMPYDEFLHGMYAMPGDRAIILHWSKTEDFAEAAYIMAGKILVSTSGTKETVHQWVEAIAEYRNFAEFTA